MGCTEFIGGKCWFIKKLFKLILNHKFHHFHAAKVFSREYSHKDFCLAHLFTDLKFEGGILGLAYVGSPRRNSVGGICTPG